MRENLQNLVVDKLIVHDVPKKFAKMFIKQNPDAVAEDVILSDTPTEFDAELTRFFHDKITSTICSSSSFEIAIDITNESRVQKLIVEFFDLGIRNGFPVNESETIRITQEVAKELHVVQTAQNPGGILLFIPCHTSQTHALAILKVEREEGVRIQRDQNTSGQTTFNVQHIKDLMLTKKTKLFKIVLFHLDSANQVSGYLCDQQQGYYQNRDVADFFLKDFLGCKLKEEPHITTKKFFETTIQFINGSDISSEQKTEVHTHLISELTNNSSTINPLDFAHRSLPADKIQSYMDKLVANKISPHTFSKDNKLIQDRIKKVQYEFESGIKILGEKDVVREKLTFHGTEDGKTRIEFIDALTKVVSTR